MDRRTALRLSLLLNAILLLAPLYTLFVQPATPSYEAVDVPLEWAEPAEDYLQVQAEAPSTPPEPIFECGIEAGPTGRRLSDAFGEVAMRRSIAYSGEIPLLSELTAGSNHRLRRVLARMRAGEPFSMGVLGGSISAGHGMHRSKEDEAHIMHRVLFDYLDKMFPAAEPAAEGRKGKDGKRNVYWNGAQPARGSDYFSYCSALHVNSDVDLVVVELAINDPYSLTYVKHFENLVRSLLEMPTQPAVLVVNSFALSFDSISMGGDLNIANSQFYDLPVVSARNALLPLALKNHTLITEWFSSNNFKPVENDLSNADLRHFAKPMHIFTGELMAAYIESQLCEMVRLEYRRPRASADELYPIEPVPRVRLQDKYAYDRDFPKLQPSCSADSAKPWPHVDQSPTRRFKHCVQGIVNLYPNGPLDGGLMVLEGSTALFEEYFRTHEERMPAEGWPTADWWGHDEAHLDWFYERGCTWKKVEANPGDLILWDSRTVHYGDAARGTEPRLATYVCFKPIKDMSPEKLKEKQECFAKSWGTSHDPLGERHQRNGADDQSSASPPLASAGGSLRRGSVPSPAPSPC
jgi:hypothetical protein